jgi:hypothetical protein
MTMQRPKTFSDFGCIQTTAISVQARGVNFTGIYCNVFVE